MKNFIFLIVGIFISLAWMNALSLPAHAVGLSEIGDLVKKSNGSNETLEVIKKPTYLPEFDIKKTDNAEDAVKSVLFKLINFFLGIAGIVAVIVIVVGGFTYTMNAGVEDLQTRAKNTIMNAVIGLLITFLSYAMVENTIRYLYQQQETADYEKVETLSQIDVVSSVEIINLQLDYGSGNFTWETTDVRNIVYDVYFGGEKRVENSPELSFSSGGGLEGKKFLFQLQGFVIDNEGNVRKDLKSDLKEIRGEKNAFKDLFNIK
jgi:hypothetical protein